MYNTSADILTYNNDFRLYDGSLESGNIVFIIWNNNHTQYSMLKQFLATFFHCFLPNAPNGFLHIYAYYLERYSDCGILKGKNAQIPGWAPRDLAFKIPCRLQAGIPVQTKTIREPSSGNFAN
jgi:hypothetical protein